MKKVKLKKKPEPIVEDGDETAEGKHLTINVNDNWRLQYDGRQFHAQKRRVRQDGDKVGIEYWSSLAYFTDLDLAIVWLGRKAIYLTPGTFDGQALVAICAMMDALKAGLLSAFSDMRGKVPKVLTAITPDPKVMMPTTSDEAANDDADFPRVRPRKKIEPAKYKEGKGGIPDFLVKTPQASKSGARKQKR